MDGLRWEELYSLRHTVRGPVKKILLAAIIIPYVIDFKVGAGVPEGCWFFNVEGPGRRCNLKNLVKWDCTAPRPAQADIEAWAKEYNASSVGKARYEKQPAPPPTDIDPDTCKR